MDLFAQAEHDEMAQAILLTPDAMLLDAVAASMSAALPNMPRKDIIAASIEINTTSSVGNNTTAAEAMAKVMSLVFMTFMLVPVGCGVEIADSMMVPAAEYERILARNGFTRFYDPLRAAWFAGAAVRNIKGYNESRADPEDRHHESLVLQRLRRGRCNDRARCRPSGDRSPRAFARR